MRWNKLMILSATFLLLRRVLVVAVHRTRKAASGGATRVHDRSVQLRTTLSRHRRGSRATDRRRDHYHPISIISPPFSIEFGLRCQQHPRRQWGSGRPPWCWRDPVGAWFSLSPTWDTTAVPGTPSSATRSAYPLTSHEVGFALGTNGRERGNRYRTPTPYPRRHTRQRKVYVADQRKQRYEDSYDPDLDHHYDLYLRSRSYLRNLRSYPY